MRIKKFLCANMREAMEKIKTEFGKNAIILETKKVKEGPLYELYGKEMIEVTAAVDDRPKKDELPDMLNSEPYMEILSDLREIKEFIKYGYADKRIRKIYIKLCDMGISSEIALKIAKYLCEEGITGDNLDDIVKEKIIRMLPPASPIKPPDNGEPKVIALIGPTGVGKTTTIAKLSAKFQVLEGVDVGLLTIDNYRVAAVEQLKVFADIASIPIEVVQEPDEFEDKLEKLKNRKIIFIDTAGKSQRNGYYLAELSNYFKIRRPDEIHLVLSANYHEKTLKSMADRFMSIGIDKMIFTKLDEAETYGPMISTMIEYKVPVSYITYGQTVPDDIQSADEVLLAELVLGERVP